MCYSIEHPTAGIHRLSLWRHPSRPVDLGNALSITFPLMGWQAGLAAAGATRGWQRVGPRPDVLACATIAVILSPLLIGMLEAPPPTSFSFESPTPR